MTSEVPKKIHALWLNFKNKSDGILPNNLQVFIDRIYSLHPSWEIKIWTSWSEIETELNTEKNSFMLKYIQNPFCNQANKSDCLRFHILNKYGGVWVDLSTYFVKSLDEMHEKYKTAFTTIYMPPYDLFMWAIKPFSEDYEKISVKEKIDNVYPEIKKIVEDNNEFVCESYFIMSPPNHPILTYVFDRMAEMWSLKKLEPIINETEHCKYLNKVLNSLMNEVFVINHEVFELLNYNINIYDCGYLWIYFIMTLSVKNFIKMNNLSIQEIPLANQDSLVKESQIPDEISKYTCYKSFCKDINYVDSNKTPLINLISATWGRLMKWSNIREERLTWNNTFLGNLITNSYNNQIQSEDFLQKLNLYNITQIKTGAYTRGPTEPMIEKINQILTKPPNERTKGGRRKYSRTKKEEKRIIKTKKKGKTNKKKR